MSNSEVITAAEVKKHAREMLRAEIVAAVCDKIAHGKVLADILTAARPAKYPSVKQWYQWMLLYPAIKAKYDEAVQVRLHGYVDKMLTMVESDARDPKHKALHISTIQWYAEKIGRRVFGQQVALTGHPDMPPVGIVSTNVSPEEAYRLMLLGGTLAKPESAGPERDVTPTPEEQDDWDREHSTDLDSFV